ncbi:MAG: hypothetical protein ABWZ42_02165 [Ilumatobacteraceae bacterium]
MASAAFADEPLTPLFTDGSLEISQAMLADAGRDCSVDGRITTSARGTDLRTVVNRIRDHVC